MSCQSAKEVNAGSFVQQCCASLKDAVLTWRADGTSWEQMPVFTSIVGDSQEAGIVEYLGNMRTIGWEHLEEPRGFRLRDHNDVTKDTLKEIQSHLEPPRAPVVGWASWMCDVRKWLHFRIGSSDSAVCLELLSRTPTWKQTLWLDLILTLHVFRCSIHVTE